MFDLASAFQARGRNSSGRYVKDGAEIAEVITFASEQGVVLIVNHAPVGSRQKALKKEALKLSRERLAGLSEDQRASALPPPAKRKFDDSDY
ncbi:hypothetical protein BFX40_02370 [Mesorhizobium sp. SEMIA 3007]|nr:hypothetical protein BFX40_02370 [Mesorhizobium sp. SEMIA 3007]